MAWIIVGEGDDNRPEQFSTIVTTGSTETADSLPLAAFHGAYWLVTAVDLTGRVSVQHVVGFNDNLAPKHAIPARIGNSVKFTSDVDISGGSLRLRIENTHTEDFTVKVVRIETKV